MQGRVAAAVCAVVVSLGTPRPPARAQPAQPPRFAPRAVAPAISLAAARAAQRDFERRRRQRLPTSYGGGSSGPCEVRVGRLCYWNNNHEKAPPEPASIAPLRAELLARLATAVRGDSTDDWVVGQLVRYYDEGRRFDDAVAAARACAGTPWWCAALRGLALHQHGDHAAAATAFDSALALQPEPVRCAWTDIRPWLDGALARDFKRQPCGPARDVWLQRFWAAARPLLILPGNDLRSELFARRAMARIQAGSALPYDLSWGDDMAELEMRYGWPTAWSASIASSGIGSAPSIVGHEPTPSFAFVPTHDAPVTALGAAESDAWALDAPLALMRYAPRYATHGFVALPHQLARFRRGDSTLVVAAWDATSDDRWAKDTLPPPKDSTGAVIADMLRAGLVVVDSGGIESRVLADSGGPRGALSLAVPSGGSYLASVELFARPRGRAARARYGLPALPSDSLASDLLLLAHGAAPDARLEDVLADALGTRTIAAGVPVGVYWETYFAADSAAPSEVTVRATRIDAAWYARLGRALRLDGVIGGGRQTPIAVRFVDVQRPGERWLGRTVALTWPREATGTYRLEVSVRSGAQVATSSEIVRVR